MRRPAASFAASAVLHLASGGLAWACCQWVVTLPVAQVERGTPVTLVLTLPAAEPAPAEVHPPSEPPPEPVAAPELVAQSTPPPRMVVETGELPPPPEVNRPVEPAVETFLVRRTEAPPTDAPPPREPPPPEPPRRQPREEPAVTVSVAAIPFQAAAVAGVEPDELPSKLPTNRPPNYPLDALQAGVQGRVVLRTLVGADGRVRSAEIEASAGFASLDRAAIAAVREWRFSPARKAGLAIEYEILVPVNFRIRS